MKNPKIKSAQKQKTRLTACLFVEHIYLRFFSFVAFAAVNRSVFSGLERNLASLTALSANSVKQLSGSLTCVLACIAACLASLRLILESLSA